MADQEDLIENINQSLQSEEAQWFHQIRNLEGSALCPKVWHRYFGADFMAEVTVQPKGRKRAKTLRATGDSIEGALNNLTSLLAAWLYPPKEPDGAG